MGLLNSSCVVPPSSLAQIPAPRSTPGSNTFAGGPELAGLLCATAETPFPLLEARGHTHMPRPNRPGRTCASIEPGDRHNQYHSSCLAL
jgi:hypothetical protein